MNLRMKAFIAPLVFCFTLVLAQKGTSSLLHAESSLKLFDTHVHNSDIKRFGKEFYTYPDSFPDLNSSFSMTDFAESIGAPNSLNPQIYSHIPVIYVNLALIASSTTAATIW